MWYHALAGWAKWAVGLRSDMPEQFRRLNKCAKCDLVEAVWVDEDAAMKAATTAFGRPVSEALCLRCGDCKCLLGVQTESLPMVTINGYHFVPAGKPEIDSARCDLGYWD